MKVILIYIGFFIALPLLFWIIQKLAKLAQFYKYLNRLNRLKAEIDCIDLDGADKEFDRLNSLAASTFDRLKQKYTISMVTDVPSVDVYIRADESAQRAKRTKAQPGRRNYRRRYWR